MLQFAIMKAPSISMDLILRFIPQILELEFNGTGSFISNIIVKDMTTVSEDDYAVQETAAGDVRVFRFSPGWYYFDENDNYVFVDKTLHKADKCNKYGEENFFSKFFNKN